MNGKTQKQINLDNFIIAVNVYNKVLKEKNLTDLVGASLHVHSLKGSVPKRYWKLINKV